MKVAALLTGRGNNTLKDKNILDVLGHPVLYYPARAGKDSVMVDHWYCSSDDEKILRIAEAMGYARIQRPDELASPTAQHVDAILHGLQVMEQRDGYVPDVVVVILANNVTIKAEWIDDCIRAMQEDPSLSSVIPVYEDNDHHPLRAKTVNSDGMMTMYEKGITGKVSTNRQDLPLCCFPAHNFWVLRREAVLNHEEGQQPWGFMGNRIKPYFIDESIDIHHSVDLLLAKEWLTSHSPEVL